MHKHILNELSTKGLISETQSKQIESYETSKPFSLHWELKTVLYLGVILLNLGLGWLIYDNIDSIGHGVIIGGIAAICIACFAYTYRSRVPFSWQQTESASPYYDYVLLLGCLMFVILEGYLQYQYEIFGTRYGLATFIPMTFFFGVAYFFDHRGALSLAITALASWLGVAVTPADILNNNDFGDSKLVWTGVLLGVILCALAFFSEQQDRKKHFAFTYLNFGIHILFIASLSGLMILEIWAVFLPLLILTIAFFIWYARNRTSLYFMVVALIYGYIALTYLVFQIDRDYTMGEALVYFYTLYFMSSCAAIIVFLLKYKTILRIKNTEQ
ncbi:DUF2157 domain-containing protein [Cytophagaceae bacterium DM2B3-1]|uniref:DUF2157 domain-containing protein n=1 Tax=Xanthocytophaga flava TaxID=3048013 RepID=A0ABT7CSX3_9BACT|nr:DUF2157 domain-containing protein [Xanthocytophaga flavus]MDJ1496085.1 DUF2157 domain-containing protein [Xanthocytophaga flavus]